MKPNNKDPKKRTNFECGKCAFICSKPSEWKRHCLTDKHKILINPNNVNAISTEIICLCGKKYKHRSTLCTHKKTCKIALNGLLNDLECNVVIDNLSHDNLSHDNIDTPNEIHITSTGNSDEQLLIMKLLKDNQEFKELIVEQNQKILEFVKEDKNVTINNTNSNNRQFNLNIFLNDHCKDAMNISDFVNSLRIETEELETIGRLGYIRGISNIFIKGLQELDETERPVHCTDKKREILYIKENNVWEKDNEREKVKRVIQDVAHKNFKGLPKWKEDNPNSDDINSNKHDEYVKILNQVVTGINPTDETGVNKIIKNIATEVCISK